MADLGDEECMPMDLNLNLSPPSTPRLRLALGLGMGVGPTSPSSAASASVSVSVNDEGEGSIRGRAWARQFEDPDGVRPPFQFGRYRSAHRWRGQIRRPTPTEALSPPFIIEPELEQPNPPAETLKEKPSTMRLRRCASATDNDKNTSNFECNICLEMARDPVVTSCGHLFCWGCLYQWLHVHSTSKECPVCKGEVTDTNITPIYGRGNSNSNSNHEGNESKLVENGEKIPPRPRANRIESLRQRFGRPISRRFMEAIRLTRRREALNDNNRAHLHAARQDEASTTAQGVENLLGAAADQILSSLSLVHFHRQTANLQRTRSSDDRWQMRQVLARRSLLRPNATTSNTHIDERDLVRLHGEGERASILGHLHFNNSANSDMNSHVNEQGLQGVVRSDNNNRERASFSSTNATILTGSRSGDAVVEQDSGISSSPQRRRHVPSCSLDSDGGFHVRKRRRLN